MSDGQPSFSFETAKRFLDALLGGDEPATFQTFADATDEPSLIRVLNGKFSELAGELFELNRRGAGVYVTVCRTDLEGRATENIIEPRAVFCDFDDGVEPPRGAGALPPSIVVQSKAGKHLYWLLGPGEKLPRWSRAQFQMAKKFGSNESVTDPPRVMRLAGSLHHKADPFLVELLKCDATRHHTLEEIAKAYGLDLNPPAPKPLRLVSGGRASGPADDFNERGGWGFLAEHGWTLLKSYGDEGHWRRPAKDQGQLSATTDHDGRTGIFYNFSSNAPPFAPSQGYTRFQAYSILKHAGDYREAAKDLVQQGFGDDDRDKWLASRSHERDEARWESITAEGPPPDLKKRKAPASAEPVQPPGGWGSPFEPPPPTDADVPDAVQPSSSKKGKKGGAKGGKGGGCKKGGKCRRPNLKDPEDGIVDFRVSAVEIFTSDPPIYHFEIEGYKTIMITHDELDDPRKFRKRFHAQLLRRPSVPYDEPEAWTLVCNYWMDIGTKIEQPSEASIIGNKLSNLRRLIRSLTLGEDQRDLDRGRILPHPSSKRPGYFILSLEAIQGRYQDLTKQQIMPHELAAYLNIIKCEPDNVRLQGRKTRCWRFKFELDEPEGWTDPSMATEAVGDQGSLPTIS